MYFREDILVTVLGAKLTTESESLFISKNRAVFERRAAVGAVYDRPQYLSVIPRLGQGGATAPQASVGAV